MGHHFVPQRYLKCFQAPEMPGSIWMFDKADGMAKLLPIKQVAQSPAFYEDDVEVALNEDVEKPGNDVIDRIRLCDAIDDDLDRRHLTYYIATMIRRVPAARARAEQLIPGVLAEVAHKTREWFEAAARDGHIGQLDINAHLAELERAEKKFKEETPIEVRRTIETPWPFESMLVAIYSMYWRLFRTDGPSYFLTSDNPAYFFDGIGLRHNDCELILPLASDLLLHCCWQGCRELVVELAEQRLVKEFNRRIAVGAQRLIFYHQRADWVLETARNRLEQLNRINWVPTRRPITF